MNAKSPRNILIYSPSVSGGIAEYTYYQATALKETGADVICLVAPDFLAGRTVKFKVINFLHSSSNIGGWRRIRKIKMLWRLVASQWRFAWEVLKRRPDLVLLDSYVEYFSPLWIWPHLFLARVCGICYAANLHDPVRNFVMGSAWWHKLSVHLAYLPLKFVLVHDQLPKPSPIPSGVRAIQVPHGLYEIDGPMVSPEIIRQSWGVKDGQKVFLAFGYVRDGKNLDLAVQALAHLPKAFLVLAGSVASAKDRPFSYYRELAAKIGVLDRCYFSEGFVANEELGRYFAGTDFVLLTYASTFYSQSGVLNIAARARKPVLASASPSPLMESVSNFQLGVAVSPDSFSAVIFGMECLLSSPPSPRWDEYEAKASWLANAQGILQGVGLQA